LKREEIGLLEKMSSRKMKVGIAHLKRLEEICTHGLEGMVGKSAM
jgi:hypothetical protein